MTNAPSPPYAAFFDVDGTLLSTRSLTSFLDFVRVELGWDAQTWFATYHAALGQLARGGASRAQLNAYYFRAFAGQREDEVTRLGAAWYARQKRDATFLNARIVTELRNHRRAGARLVLVTGSFMPVLRPLMQDLECVEALCTEPELQLGVYTGKLSGSPCIGAAKATAVIACAIRERLPLELSHAYGDDESDAAMLGVVGFPHWVEPSSSYRSELSQRVWSSVNERPQ